MEGAKFAFPLIFFIQFVYCRIEVSQDSNVIDLHSPPSNYGIELALKHCQQSFEWEKWNCPSTSFLLKSTTNVIDREQAFVTAILTASQLYTTYMNYSRKFSTEFESLKSHDDELYAYTRDVQLFVKYHNIRAGKLAIKKSIREICRCHGVSGSCSMQTCWKTLNAFSTITDALKEMYENSQMVQLDNFGNIDFQNVHENQLLYIVESPNYCLINIIPGWKGMRNRQCSKGNRQMSTKYEKNSCKNLCKSCGLNVVKRMKKEQKRCNFKFNWKSGITFDICDEHVSQYFCS